MVVNTRNPAPLHFESYPSWVELVRNKLLTLRVAAELDNPVNKLVLIIDWKVLFRRL